MDPISALSLASNVIQFVDFASKVVAAGLDIYRSSHGTTQENAARERSVTRLKSFTESLKIINASHDRPVLHQSPSVPRELAAKHRELSAPHIAAIQTVASECRELCNEIIALGDSIKVRKGTAHRAFRAMGATTRGLLKEKEIRDLEGRLKTSERRLGLCFFPLLNEHHRYTVAIAQHIASQGESLSDGTTPAFQNIYRKLDALEEKIAQTVLPTLMRKATQSSNPLAAAPKCAHNIASITDDIGVLNGDLALLEKQQSFIKSLHFTGQNDRHEAIPEAHRVTFEWVLPERSEDGSPPPQQDQHRRDKKRGYLSQWLRHGSGIFWVSGRPGSGKSTLMKFIADHPRTRAALEEWADGKDLAIAAHYFWIDGTTLQKSLKGMYLQLLFDIMRHQPELAQDVFLSRFQNWNAGHSAEVTATRGEDKWTVKELTAAIETLARNTRMDLRVCVFIDGLDEYEGDHFGLCQILKSFESSTSIKLCVASRPWNVFQTAFGADPTRVIHVHELTCNDIQAFAEDQLQALDDLGILQLRTSEIIEMGQYITETANGVFLWVVLATKTLRVGVVDGDTVGDIWSRLKGFPNELEPFFERILNNVGPAHQKYMAEGLKIFLCDEVVSREANRHCWYFTSYALARHNALPPTEKDLRDCLDITRDQMQRRINARFGGLLTMNKYNDTVSIIHRTAFDFLRSDSIQKYLDSVSPGFKPILGLLKGILCYFRWLVLDEQFSPHSAEIFLVPQNIEKVSGSAMHECCDETTRLLDFYRVMALEPSFRGSEKKLENIRVALDSHGILFADTDNGTEIEEPTIDPALDLARIFSHEYVDAKETEGIDFPHMHLISEYAPRQLTPKKNYPMKLQKN